MAELHTRICDRCRQDTHGRYKVVTIHVQTHVGADHDHIERESMRDICIPCMELLERWIGRSNISTQGDRHRPKEFRGPEWVEVCPHHVPCAGPCPTPQWRRA